MTPYDGVGRSTGTCSIRVAAVITNSACFPNPATRLSCGFEQYVVIPHHLGVIVCETDEETDAVSDDLAPEHLEIQTRDPGWYQERPRNTGRCSSPGWTQSRGAFYS